MARVNYQTIRLGRGAHRSPADGACVMELASMLAGEPFSDHPRSVSGAIGSFLRAYNDVVDDRRRNDLYAYAAAALGTAASPQVESLRLQRLIEWGDERFARERARRRIHPLRRLLARQHRFHDVVHAGVFAVCAIGQIDDDAHAEALALVDELIAIGAQHSAAPGRAVRRGPERASVAC